MPRREIELDLSPLGDLVDEVAGKIPFKKALASNKFAQVGLNLFRHTENDTIWQLAEEDDGAYIVRAEPEQKNDNHLVESSEDGQWTAVSDANGEGVTVSFRKQPLCRFATRELGLTTEAEVKQFQQYLIAQTRNPEFVESLYEHAKGEAEQDEQSSTDS